MQHRRSGCVPTWADGYWPSLISGISILPQMALKPCSECGARISTRADSCPQCGAKEPASMGPVRRLLLGFAALFGAVYLFAPGTNSITPSEPPAKPVKTAEQLAVEEAHKVRSMKAIFVVTAIKHGLRDPDSARWKFVGVNDDASVVCVEYRAKNGFGGLNLERAAYAKGKVSSTAASWNRHCAGKSFHDLTSTANTLKK